MEKLADNPNAGGMANAGIGLGVGMGMMSNFGNAFSNIGNEAMTQQPVQQQGQQAAGRKCTKCGAVIPEGMKFCGSCGERVVTGLVCSNCRYENPLGTKFCGNCGCKLVNKCGKCGTENAPGQKFCGNCGSPLQ